MALMERVTTLIRANLNDLIDRAEDPERILKQIILDMQNQLMQVKTQVAIAIADQHVIAKKKKELDDAAANWVRKAELAVEKAQDDLARAALERSLTAKSAGQAYAQQLEDQFVQVENLKSALHKLQEKLAEAQTKCDALIAKNRRARAAQRANEAKTTIHAASSGPAFDRMSDKVNGADALSRAMAEAAGESIEDRFASLEKEEEIERLLDGIKARKQI